MIKRKHEPQSLAQAMFVLAVCNKAQATFQAETCLMSHQSLSHQGIKRESLTAVEFGSRTPKSYNGSCENCKQLFEEFRQKVSLESIITSTITWGLVKSPEKVYQINTL